MIADTLRAKADGLQKKIDHCLRERLTNTRKRAEEDAAQRREGQTLAAVQSVMRQIADLYEAGNCPPELSRWKYLAEFDSVVRAVLSIDRNIEEYPSVAYWREKREKLSPEQRAVRSLLQPVDPRAEKLYAMVRDSARWNIPGFFWTPRPPVEQMLELADLRPGMRVLEPSAGRGDIADVIRELHPEVSLDLIEYNLRLQEILTLKGYQVLDEGDFLAHRPAALYDRVLMNPPFENLQDIDHVRHACTFLKPGGRLVAIMSPSGFFRSDKKAQAFRQDYGACETIELPSGSFENTGVSARIIVIDKPAEREVAAPPPIAGQADPEYGTRLEAARITAEWRVGLRPKSKQLSIEDLPLFGGERQGGLYEEGGD